MAYKKEYFRKEHKDLFESSLDLIYVHDLKGYFLDANDLTLTCFGYSQEELSNISFIDLIDNEQSEEFFDSIKEIKENGKFLKYRLYKVKINNGNYIYIETYGIPIRNNNEIYAILNIGTDITENRIAEQKLKKSEEKYRLISENANDLITVLNEKFEIEFINEEVHKIMGYSKEDLISKSALVFIHPDDIKKAAEKLKKGFEIGEETAEVRIRTKKGDYFWFEIRGKAFIDKDGVKKGLLIARDIDERKRAEQKLKESEEKYRLISENANDLISVINKNNIYEYINERVHKRLMGYLKEDLIGKSGLALIHPDDIKEAANKIKKGFEIGEETAQVRIRKKKGDYIWLEIRGKTFINKDGEKKGLLISRDISERKRAEQKIKDSEEKYRLISENANDLIRVYNDGFKIEYINESAHERSLGYSKEDLLGTHGGKLIHPNELSDLISYIKSARETGEFKREGRIRHKNGNWVWFENKGKSFTDDEGNLKLLTISRDITERKKSEEKLRESEEQYRLISENANDLIVILDNKLKVDYVNEEVVLKLWGYPRGEIVGRSGFEFIHPDDHNLTAEAFARTLKTGVGELVRIRLKDKMENWLWFQIMGTPFLNNKGEQKVIIIGRDVNKQYKTEQKLKESERGLRERVKELTCIYVLSKLVENPNLSLKEIIRGTLDLILPALKFPDLTCAKIIFNNDEFKTSNFKETEWELSKIIKVQEEELKIKLYRLEDKPFLKEEENLINDIGRRLKTIIEKRRAEEHLRQFISTVSHELRNPITVLVQSINNLDRYKDKISEEMKTKLNETVSRNVKLLYDLVEDLLIISRIDEEGVKLIWREYHPLNIIHDIIELMIPHQEGKEITIEVNVDKEIRLFGDNRRISQIFRILIDNALKFSYEKSKIIINAFDHYKGKYNSQGTDGVLFEFKDFGIGIREEDLPNLFERFFRARNVEKISGTGLGLCIAKDITTLHNGEIFVESEYEKGTTFSLFLPRLEKSL